MCPFKTSRKASCQLKHFPKNLKKHQDSFSHRKKKSFCRSAFNIQNDQASHLKFGKQYLKLVQIPINLPILPHFLTKSI